VAEKELSVEALPGGGFTLHRFKKEHDSASPGKKNEQVWHRMVALMLLAGRTNSEIAAASNCSPATISHLRAQKWFQQLLATLANQAGEEVLGALKSYALEAVEGIYELATNAEKETTRLNAYRTLLEHAEGKPVQKVISDITHSVSRNPSEEYREIMAELEGLRREKALP